MDSELSLGNFTEKINEDSPKERYITLHTNYIGINYINTFAMVYRNNI